MNCEFKPAAMVSMSAVVWLHHTNAMLPKSRIDQQSFLEFLPYLIIDRLAQLPTKDAFYPKHNGLKLVVVDY